jgi:hypothetical protein
MKRLLDPNITKRAVPTTVSTFLAYSPGFLLDVDYRTQIYFFAQIPVARNFNATWRKAPVCIWFNSLFSGAQIAQLISETEMPICAANKPDTSKTQFFAG